MESKYSFKEIEERWYQYWLDEHLFKSEPNAQIPYTIVIPPPNVTGVLHMGHVLNETIQDILVRRARLEGRNACWVPGTDHASIATEAKVIKQLKEQGINKSDLTREQFLTHAWAWKEKHGSIILQQLRKLGCSCDWDRTAFTMDEIRSQAVIKVFCDLYEKGLIYRGLRMVNWDPERQTALSDEEVIYHDEHSHLYYLKYRVVGDVGQISEGCVVHKDEKGYYAVVATTRPETIMGDVAVCINPTDPKNAWLKGKKVIVPLVNREVPIIEDRYVDIEFGTGCLKVTPAHDANDYMLGEKYDLEAIDIFTPDARISEKAGMYVGMDRFDCRKQIATDLERAGLLEKVEDYENKVGYSERTNVPIEPRLSLQWFVKMQHFAKIALNPVMNDEISFHPTKYKNTYRNWLENIKDWCISRQLWWGHRIPAYFLPNQEGVAEEDKLFVVATSREEAWQKAKELLKAQGQIAEAEQLRANDLIQDEGALDTWFSSWLWPISLFDGIANSHNAEMTYYYPTSDLVTGPDIIFFWVARMIMAGYEYTGKMPFRNVYFTGIVRDKQGRKMSKSLGNSPDPLDLIEKYGADGVRMGMMLCAPAGNDILFDEGLCEQGRNFCNKIWNCFRLMKSWKGDIRHAQKEDVIACQWMETMLHKTEREVADLFKKYRLNEALMVVYKLFWDTFSSWYLEMIKPQRGDSLDKATLDRTWEIWGRMLQLLHPFMPFITEALWQEMTNTDGSIMKSRLVENVVSEDSLAEMVLVQEIVGGVRNIRGQKNIPNKEPLTLYVLGKQKILNEAYIALLEKLCNINEMIFGADKPHNAATFVIDTTEFAIPLAKYIDMYAERSRLEEELAYQTKFLATVRAKLSNERFVKNAKPEIVELERKKEHDAKARIDIINQSLRNLV